MVKIKKKYPKKRKVQKTLTIWKIFLVCLVLIFLLYVISKITHWGVDLEKEPFSTNTEMCFKLKKR